MPFDATYVAIILPLLLMYLLVFLRMIERRQMPYDERTSIWSILSIRDAALVTLALDLAELVQGVIPFVLQMSQLLPVAIAGGLFVLHLTVFLLAARHHRDSTDSKSRTSTRGIFDAYVALTLLMTNAVTIVSLMQSIGEGL